jgi:hypothetical protein
MKTGGLIFNLLLFGAISVLLYMSRDYFELSRKLPQLVGGLALILLSWELGLGLWKRKQAAAQGGEQKKERLSAFIVKRWLTLAISLLVYVILLSKLGFLLMTSLLMLSILWFFDVRKPLVLVVYTAVSVGVVYGIFAKLLYVPLPAGTWW